MQDARRRSATVIFVLILEVVLFCVLASASLSGFADMFGIEWFCLGSREPAANAYFQTFLFLILGSGLALMALTIVTYVRLRLLTFALPAAWCAVIVLAEGVAGAAIGEQPCPG